MAEEHGKITKTGRLSALIENLRAMAILGRSLLLRSPRPVRKGKLALAGLSGPVEVIRDRWDVSHIYASSLEDVFFAQGFIHAQERFWQMDFNRRLGAGRLSEILGTDAVPLDRWLRILSVRRVAETQAAEVENAATPIMEAYAAGVNAYINRGKMPVEIALLGYQPDPWTPADSLTWVKMMAWELCVNWESEILRAQLIDKLGPEAAAELEPPHAAVQPLIIPPGVDYSCIGSAALERADQAKPFTGPTSQEGIGSNNWVLSGSRTKTGQPLLANDMHLGMTIPAIWYENHLVAPGLNVTGVSLPGVPFVIAGHNQYVAWGFTNGFSDVQDLYIERLRRESGRVEYEFKGEWLEAQVIREEIKIKGEASVFEDVISTHHGPIINALTPDFAGEDPLALRWTALELDESILSLYQMNIARSCTEFREALREWSVPSQNIVYADVHNDIGYTLPGKLPIRAQGVGQVPVPGWTGDHEWLGYVPFYELPHMSNPELGYIATANNKVADDDYPYWIGADYVSGNRAQRIVELIDSHDKMGVSDFQAMHLDLVSPYARRMRNVLKNLESDDPELTMVLDRFRGWDGTLTADSSEAGLYQVFLRRIIFRILKPALGDLTERYGGKGPTPVIKEGTMFGERSREWLIANLEAESSKWFDLGDGLTREDHLLAALRESVDEIKRLCGQEIGDWSWGKLHTLTFNHTLGSVQPLDRFFNRGPYPIGGDGDTIANSHATLQDLTCQTIVGPPFRFIADLSDWNRTLGMLVPGQSGHPASPTYANNIESWFRGEYHPMVFDRENVLDAADAVLNLIPVK
jgi:penicillin amidase